MNLNEILVTGLLLIAGIIDIKYKKVNILLLFLFIIIGIISDLYYQKLSLMSILGGITIGAAIVVIAMITQGRIGKGDGMVLIVTGLFLGFFDNLFLLFSAAFLAAILGAILLIMKRVNKNYEMPFIPFLFIAWIGDLILWS